MAGHQVLIHAELSGVGDGLTLPVKAGFRSMLFQFASLGLEDCAGPVSFGGQVLEVLEGGIPGGQMTAVVGFWADLAEVYATPGAKFSLWMGRNVGNGEVIGFVDQC